MLDNDKNTCSPRFYPRKGERSFTLIETIIAVSLVAVLLIELASVHGNAIAFNQYSRRVLQASYLAKRVMSEIEYFVSTKSPLKELSIKEKDKVFEDSPDFSYSVTFEPMPHALDLMFKIMSGGLLGGDKKEEGEDKDGAGAGAMLEQIKGMIQQSVGEEPIWVAKVEVSWADGARRDSTSLAMIVTDLKKLEESVGTIMDTAPAPKPGGGTTPAAAGPGSATPGSTTGAGGSSAGGSGTGGAGAGGASPAQSGGVVPP